MTLNATSGKVINRALSRTWQLAGAPLSGTSGHGAGSVNPKDLLMDSTNGTLYMNEGTRASPYWTPVSYDQPGIRAVSEDFRDVNDVKAVANTDAEAILDSGLRIFGQGIADTDSGLTVAAVAEVGNVATIATTNEDAHLIALGFGDTTALVQPDTNGPAVIDVEFSNVSAITARTLFCGFLGTVADALDPPVTGSGTTITLVQDDLAGMLMDAGLTDADGLFLAHNKSNAAASIETDATGVDLSSTMPAAATYTRWRAELATDGDITVFVDKAQVGTISIALDVDEECMPVFLLESQAAAIKSATVKRVAMWFQRV